MPGYLLAGLMTIGMFLPLAIAKVMEKTVGERGPTLTLVGAVMWVLTAGGCVVVWTASYDLHRAGGKTATYGFLSSSECF